MKCVICGQDASSDGSNWNGYTFCARHLEVVRIHDILHYNRIKINELEMMTEFIKKDGPKILDLMKQDLDDAQKRFDNLSQETKSEVLDLINYKIRRIETQSPKSWTIVEDGKERKVGSDENVESNSK